MNKIISLLFALLLALLIFIIRFYFSNSVAWLSNWGIYLLIIPVLFFLATALFREMSNSKFLIAYTAGVIISILLTRESWIDTYVLQKVIATIFGTLISLLLYYIIKK
jgi:hypothetical protein